VQIWLKKGVVAHTSAVVEKTALVCAIFFKNGNSYLLLPTKISRSLRLNYASDSQQIKHPNQLKISTSPDSFQSLEEHCIHRPGNNSNTQTTENNSNWHTLVHF